MDWFALEPATMTEEVMHKIENGASKVLNSFYKKFRNKKSNNKQ